MTKPLAKKSNEAQEALGLRDQLVGAWQLLSYVSTPKDPTKEATYPLGKNPNGILLYTADGYMSAQIQALVSSAKDQQDENATQQEQLTGYLGYTGPFYIDETGSETVLQHHMSLSSFPAWLGDTQRRFARLNGDILVLSAESEIIIEVGFLFISFLEKREEFLVFLEEAHLITKTGAEALAGSHLAAHEGQWRKQSSSSLRIKKVVGVT